MGWTRRLLLALAPGPAACARRGGPPLEAADRDFVSRALADGMGTVALGQLAARRSSNPAVRQFAQRMVAEHRLANRELAAIGSRAGVAPPTALDEGRGDAERRLSALTGAEFDRRYMAQQAQDHALQLALFRRQARSGIDPELRAFVARHLPVVEAHAHMAEAVLDSVAVPGD
jgi:putative membrane protein